MIATHGIATRWVHEVIDLTGLDRVADRLVAIGGSRAILAVPVVAGPLLKTWYT